MAMMILPALVAALVSEVGTPSSLSLANLDSQECQECFQMSSDHGRGLENNRRELNACYDPIANIGPLDHRGCYDAGAAVGFSYGIGIAILVLIILGLSLGIPLCCMCCAPKGCCGIGKLPREASGGVAMTNIGGTV